MEITDISTLVSPDILEKLKCNKCRNYLSYFPVYISTDNRNICGRCAQPERKNYIRNKAYEMVCEHINFPCRYVNEGCFERVPAHKMAAHEKFCAFKTVKCPTTELTQCEWEDSQPNLVQHCKDHHTELILKNGEFQQQFSKSEKSENLLEFNETFVVFRRNYDSTINVLEYSVHQLENENNVVNRSYKISFEYAARNLSIENDLCGYDQQRSSQICLNVLKDSDETFIVINGKINFNCTPKQDIVSLFKSVNEELLAQLRCSMCDQYLMPPLDQHLRSQVKCAKCKAKYPPKNPSPAETMNCHLKLDGVAKFLNYPCKYEKNGCTFVSQPHQMKEHQKGCSYEEQICPLNEFIQCMWKGLSKDVKNHVQDSHANMMVNSTEISEHLEDGGVDEEYYSLRYFFEVVSNHELTKCYVINFSNNLFQLIFFQRDERFWWGMHKIGDGHSKNRFKYEIEISDRNKAERKLVVRQVCTTEPAKKNEVSANAEGYCYFQRDQIENLLNQNTITFKVHIVI